MRLFHFSEEAGIEVFRPRPVRVPQVRPKGREWLNGPLVWAIDEDHQAMYFFPRDCPRILLWPTAGTTKADRDFWFAATTAGIIAHVEWIWFDRLKVGVTFRYELPAAPFEDLGNAGMWVAREPVTPLGVERIADIPAALAAAGVELRVMPSLTPLRGVWETTLHASGIRLSHAEGW